MISIDRFLPQGEAISSLIQQMREGRMNHAILISGERGTGKWSLAQAIAAFLLCEDIHSEQKPCGKCRSCTQMEGLSHPDLIVMRKGKPLVPTETKNAIPVSDVLEMQKRISLQGFQGNRHIVMIYHSEDLNEAAQNKMLKTLEEPPAGTFFLMTSVNPDRLLPTLISRCRPLKIQPWGDREILRVLAENNVDEIRAQESVMEAGGSFGKALTVSSDEEYWKLREKVLREFLFCDQRSDILKTSSEWKDRKDEADVLFSILENAVHRMMHGAVTADSSRESMRWMPSEWIEFTEKARSKDYVQLFEAIALARKRVRFSVNFQAVLEQLILSLMEAVHI